MPGFWPSFTTVVVFCDVWQFNTATGTLFVDLNTFAYPGCVPFPVDLRLLLRLIYAFTPFTQRLLLRLAFVITTTVTYPFIVPLTLLDLVPEHIPDTFTRCIDPT